jgi:hypothetical protein
MHMGTVPRSIIGSNSSRSTSRLNCITMCTSAPARAAGTCVRAGPALSRM